MMRAQGIAEQLACPGPHDTVYTHPPVHYGLVLRLVALEARTGHRYTYTSGVRCELHNTAVGGEDDSTHLVGTGVDLTHADFARHAPALIAHALLLGFRVLVYADHLHLDFGKPGTAPLLIKVPRRKRFHQIGASSRWPQAEGVVPT